MGKKTKKPAPTAGQQAATAAVVKGPNNTTGGTLAAKGGGTTLGGKKKKSSVTSNTGPLSNEGSHCSASEGLCLQCDLLTHAVEEAVKTFSKDAPQQHTNLHLVLKEIRYICLEIGQCCGRPDDYTRSSSGDASISPGPIFWKNLDEHIKNQEKASFQPPPPLPTAATNTSGDAEKKSEKRNTTEKKSEKQQSRGIVL
jgi:hypothetical protein